MNPALRRRLCYAIAALLGAAAAWHLHAAQTWPAAAAALAAAGVALTAARTPRHAPPGLDLSQLADAQGASQEILLRLLHDDTRGAAEALGEFTRRHGAWGLAALTYAYATTLRNVIHGPPPRGPRGHWAHAGGDIDQLPADQRYLPHMIAAAWNDDLHRFCALALAAAHHDGDGHALVNAAAQSAQILAATIRAQEGGRP